MRRRTLDLIFSIGALLVAALLLMLGLVLQNQADFAADYVQNQLAEQRIVFTPVKGLAPEEQEIDCLVENAGKPLDSGKQAECYANEYIALHLTEVNDGKTYAETSGASRAAAQAAESASESGASDAADPDAVPRRVAARPAAHVVWVLDLR